MTQKMSPQPSHENTVEPRKTADSKNIATEREKVAAESKDFGLLHLCYNTVYFSSIYAIASAIFPYLTELGWKILSTIMINSPLK